MNDLKKFLTSFLQNSGHHVFVSLLVAKVCAFLSSLIVIRWLPASEFGVVTTVFSVFSLFVPFSGLGSSQSLLRFGSILSSQEEKEKLSSYLFKKGWVYQIIISIIFFLVSFFYLTKMEEVLLVFAFFTIRLLGVYFHNHILSEQRICGNNQTFAQINNWVNGLGLLLTFLLTYFFKLHGYLLAMAIMPFISLFWFKKNNLRTVKLVSPIQPKELWTYALHTSGTAVLSDALFALDILLLGMYWDSHAVAQYKVALLLPANVTFLSLAFMQSDFPKLAHHYQDKIFLKNYILNYYKIFIPLSVVIFLGFYLFKDIIITSFFGAEYQKASTSFVILTAAFLSNILLRNLYGNMLSAVGEMKVNTQMSIGALLLLSFLSYCWVPQLGVVGMAWAQSLTLVSTGVFLGLNFFKYYKKLK